MYVSVSACVTRGSVKVSLLGCFHRRERDVRCRCCSVLGRDAVREGCDTKSSGGLWMCHGACGRRSANLSTWDRVFGCALLSICAWLHIGDMWNALNAVCLCIILLLLVHCRYLVIMLCCYIALIDCLEILMKKDTGFLFKCCY